MTDNRAGGTQLLVTTMLAAASVGAVLVIDAYMQDDLQDPVASNHPVVTQKTPPAADEAGPRVDPGAACWGPFYPQVCLPPLIPTDEEKAATSLDEPVARSPKRARKPRADDLPVVDMSPPEEVALTDRVFASVIDSWHAPRACANEVGTFSGTPTVRMEMDIDSSGRVKEARALDIDDNTEQRLASCLETRARNLRFPPQEVRRETTRDATFVF